MEARRSYYRYIIAFGIFSLSFGVYLGTLCPTVSDLDSGELISVCYTLGIAHPAGYPLYTLLGKLFTLLPIRTAAFRVNVMSAFFASLTATLIYFVILKLSELGHTEREEQKPKSRELRAKSKEEEALNPMLYALSSTVAAASAALLFAFSRAFWSYAVIAEVYTMKAFFLALLILILVMWRTTHPSAKKTWLLWIGAFIYGLSLGTRITMVLFAPAFLVYILIAKESKGHRAKGKERDQWKRGRKEAKGRVPESQKAGRPGSRLSGLPAFMLYVLRSMLHAPWLIMLLFFLLGSSIYLYLPIRSLSDPPIDWGDPENWDNFLAHVTGKQFRFMLFNATKPMLWVHVKEYIYSFAMQFSLLIYPVGIMGAARFLRERRKEFALLAAIFLTDIAFNLFLYTGTYWLEHFFMSSFVVFAIWTGWGMKSIMGWVDSRLKTQDPRPKIHVSPVLRVVSCVLYLAFALAPILPYKANHDHADQSQNWDSYDYGSNILDLVEDNAVIVTNGINPTFPVWYFQYVEKMRPDVTVVDANLLTSRWFYHHLRDRSLEAARIPFDRDTHGSYEGWLNAMAMDIVSRNIASRPFYFTFKEPNISDRYILTPRFYFMSTGPVYQLENRRPEVAIAEPSIQHKASIRFSDSLVFLGYDAKAMDGDMIRRGQVVHLTYYWKLLDDISDNLTVDVFFTDAGGNYAMRHGVPRFHHIHELAYDLPLADIYEPGQMIKEEYKLIVPSGITPGRYYINVGVCMEKTFLKADSGKGMGNFVEVGMTYVL